MAMKRGSASDASFHASRTAFARRRNGAEVCAPVGRVWLGIYTDLFRSPAKLTFAHIFRQFHPRLRERERDSAAITAGAAIRQRRVDSIGGSQAARCRCGRRRPSGTA
jgi:hypothetical protein